MHNNILNVGIGFVTGRKHFQNVLRSYVNNWLEQGLVESKKIRLHLFVAYDLKYFNTNASDYKNIPPEVANMVDSIHMYGQTEIASEIQMLQETGVLNAREAEMIFGDGYAKKRNAVLYFAVKQGMDRLIFMDDDEYPVATLKNRQGRLYWMGQSVLGTHLKFGADSDITHGHHCGYISPIPFVRFDNRLTESDFRLFIEALSNDILSWDSLRRTLLENGGVTYANADIINEEQTREVKEVNGMKFISGANLCFNLRNLGHRLPPFYNPPGARGEDTFMSACLSDIAVRKVPCYTFHDGFLNYRHLLDGVLPTALQATETDSPVLLKRFINAAIGWVRYKPLLTYITQQADYEDKIAEMKYNLQEVVPKLCNFFGNRQFEQLHTELDFYHARVRQHYSDFVATREAWSKVLEHLLAEIGEPELQEV